MFGSTILDVAIGLVFVYSLYSLFATTINEIISSIFGLRAKKLELAIKRMLTDDNPAGSGLSNRLFDEFFAHPLIKYMNPGGWLKRKPSYLSADDFAKVIMDSLKKVSGVSGPITKDTMDTITTAGLKTLDQEGRSDTVRLIKSFLEDASGDPVKFKTQIEKWFDKMMERTTGWYKRQVQWITFVIGFVIAMSFNADTFNIVKHLSKDNAAREQIVQLATNYVKSYPSGVRDTVTVVKSDSIDVIRQMDSLVVYADSLYRSDIAQSNEILGMGWTSFRDFWNNITLKGIFGWLITTLAISLGAPFWFDLLSKLVQLRGTGPRPGEKEQKQKQSNS